MAHPETHPASTARPSSVSDRFGRPLRDLRISVTDRCNFRCGYCMPAKAFPDGHRFLPASELLTFDEIERSARLFVQHLGVTKIRLTGGEPLLRPELPRLVERLARIDGLTDLTLTTNGLLLAQQASALKAAGLSRLTVSMDSLDPVTFARMSGAGRDLSHVLAGIDAAVAAGFTALKFNCVVIRNQNEDSLVALAERFRNTPHVVRFIEYMDVGTQNDWSKQSVVPASEIVARIQERWPLTPHAVRVPGEVARRYSYDDGSGEIGIIASVSEPFCGDCQRARLSAQGTLLTCLFSEQGLDVRSLLRDGAHDDGIVQALHSVWTQRYDRYSERRSAQASQQPTRRRLEMYQVGG
jgi:GTP 3',8-cyclase